MPERSLNEFKVLVSFFLIRLNRAIKVLFADVQVFQYFSLQLFHNICVVFLEAIVCLNVFRWTGCCSPFYFDGSLTKTKETTKI